MAVATAHDQHIDTERRDALVSRLFEAAIGTFDLFSVYLGERLGLYESLARHGPTTATELAERAQVHERYAREWLEQQAVTGLLEVVDVSAEPRRYALPASHAEVLVDHDSLNNLTGLARQVVGASRPLPAILEAFRTGGGVPFADYGADLREGIADANRRMFQQLLAAEWLPTMPDVHARLQAEPPACVADLGCGTGWSTIALARAYPLARVSGLDLDADSIRQARLNAERAGLADRIAFEAGDAANLSLAGTFDLVTAFEAVHDMARPVQALEGMRRLAGASGVVLIADERVADSFIAPGNAIERLCYGFSVLHCLPASLAEQPSAGIGTVLRAPALRGLADAAGFRSLQVLPIQNDFWRLYRLDP
jgi:hypothetical protein